MRVGAGAAGTRGGSGHGDRIGLGSGIGRVWGWHRHGKGPALVSLSVSQQMGTMRRDVWDELVPAFERGRG